MRTFTVLGLETSCDETAAGVVCGRAPGPGESLSNVVLSQLEEHAAFGGVVPEIAARAHVEALDLIVEAALAEAGIPADRLDAIAATAGPGLIGGVMVGLTTAKALALAWGQAADCRKSPGSPRSDGAADERYPLSLPSAADFRGALPAVGR